MAKYNTDQERIVLLLKSMKKEYIENTIKRGQFCFNHPIVFSEWDDADAAQYDRWEAHSAYSATDGMIFPIAGENNDGMPIYESGRKFFDKAIVHEQFDSVKHTPICCFRLIEKREVEFTADGFKFSLGDTATRIKQEFGHDAFIIIQALPFLQRLGKRPETVFAGNVVYEDTLNQYDFSVDEKQKPIVEQLFRKDKKYEWQKEYRVALVPSKESRVFIELGSIEDITVSGEIEELCGVYTGVFRGV